MSRTASAQGLIARLHSKQASLEELQIAAQLAIQVEFTTIPAYLTGLYSISEPSSEAYQFLRSVVMEEMFHVNQAANLLIALGGKPRFTGDVVPTYPNYLPHANKETTPYISLNRASKSVFLNTFAAIETPAPYGVPAQLDNYDTIGQLYGGLLLAILGFNGNAFAHANEKGRQRLDLYIGKFGGKVIEVSDDTSATMAIYEIVKQGEGTVPGEGGLSIQAPYNPYEQFGAYNYYGKRTDNTYGPIIGTPNELSHFAKFRQIGQSPDPFPETLPIVSNPATIVYGNPKATSLSNLFDLCYSVMLRALELSFSKTVHGVAGDPYFGLVIGLMHRVLPDLAAALMSLPIDANGKGEIGPNAAPRWLWVAEANTLKLKDNLDAMIAEIETALQAGDTAVGALRQQAGSKHATLLPLQRAQQALHALLAANKASAL